MFCISSDGVDGDGGSLLNRAKTLIAGGDSQTSSRWQHLRLAFSGKEKRRITAHKEAESRPDEAAALREQVESLQHQVAQMEVLRAEMRAMTSQESMLTHLFNSAFHTFLLHRAFTPFYHKMVSSKLLKIVEQIDIVTAAECMDLKMPETIDAMPSLQLCKSFDAPGTTGCTLWRVRLLPTTNQCVLKVSGKLQRVLKFNANLVLSFALEGLILVCMTGKDEPLPSVIPLPPDIKSFTKLDSVSFEPKWTKQIGKLSLDLVSEPSVRIGFVEPPKISVPIHSKVTLGNVPLPMQEKIKTTIEKEVTSNLRKALVAPASIAVAISLLRNIPTSDTPAPLSTVDAGLIKLSKLLGTPVTHWGLSKQLLAILALTRERIKPVEVACNCLKKGKDKEKVASAALVAAHIQLTMMEQTMDWSPLMIAATEFVGDSFGHDADLCASISSAAKLVLLSTEAEETTLPPPGKTGAPITAVNTSMSASGPEASPSLRVDALEGPMPSHDGHPDMMDDMHDHLEDSKTLKHKEEGALDCAQDEALKAAHRLCSKPPLGKWAQTSNSIRGTLASPFCAALSLDQALTSNVVAATGLSDSKKAASVATAALVMGYIQLAGSLTVRDWSTFMHQADQVISDNMKDLDAIATVHSRAKECLVGSHAVDNVAEKEPNDTPQDEALKTVQKLCIKPPLGKWAQTSNASKGTLASPFCAALSLDQALTSNVVAATGLSDSKKAASVATAALVMGYIQLAGSVVARDWSIFMLQAEQVITDNLKDLDAITALHSSAKDCLIASHAVDNAAEKGLVDTPQDEALKTIQKLCTKPPLGKWAQTSNSSKGTLASPFCTALSLDQALTGTVIATSGISDRKKAASVAAAALVMAYIQLAVASSLVVHDWAPLMRQADQVIVDTMKDLDTIGALHSCAKECIVVSGAIPT
eukprot:NODE_199_length_2964_cov_20.425554_g185_i0.p1 GENE.NODE_199_length_2964_cov_20.425554_g185_i0~~NODE_199_length_2964_cov_20.425554_g185_i0.p1  ORF type:complete len:927 (-),score=161.29 NODE_199_length_2964_cov_20.425554_g185_i0:134-2914(-)